MRVVRAGVRLFERDNAKGIACAYRASQAALPLVEPHATRQVLRLPLAVMRELLLTSPHPGPAGQLGPERWRSTVVPPLRDDCVPGGVIVGVDGEDGLIGALAALLTPSGALRPMASQLERRVALFELAVVASSMDESGYAAGFMPGAVAEEAAELAAVETPGRQA